MAQLLVRQLDEEAVERLKARARAHRTSVEALAREAIHRASELTREEKIALIDRNLVLSRQARVPGAPQTPGWVFIREDRDNDH